MNEDYLYSIIGKLYVETFNYQRAIPQFQTAIQTKDQEILTLREEVESYKSKWTTPNEND